MHGSLFIYAAVGSGLLLAASAFPSRGRKAGRTTCLQCDYPLVDPNAAVCPQCGQNPHAAAARVAGWDMGVSLRRRRVTHHALALLVGIALAGTLALVAMLVPRTYREKKQMEFRPQSQQYRMTLSAERAYRRNALGGPQEYAGSAVQVEVGHKGEVYAFKYVPERPGDGFSYESAHDRKRNERSLTAESVNLWLIQEVGLDGNDPRVRAEAAKLAAVVGGFKPPIRVFEDLGNALKAADPEFREDGSPPLQVAADGVSPALYALAAVIPYLAVASAVEVWHARRRRRYAAAARRRRDPAATAARTLSIIFTDMVGYTEKVDRLPPDDILELIREYRNLVAAAVGARKGLIVKNQGDAFLVTFESGTDAVLASVDLLREVRLRNATVPEFKRFELRIGCSTGEVAVEDGDVFGPPVNIASRVQHEAGAGEVFFTEATAKAMNHNEVRFEKRGEFTLKGVPGPVVVYVALDPDPPELRPRPPRTFR
jgi:class 3 adenylate cyclase